MSSVEIFLLTVPYFLSIFTPGLALSYTTRILIKKNVEAIDIALAVTLIIFSVVYVNRVLFPLVSYTLMMNASQLVLVFFSLIFGVVLSYWLIWKIKNI